MGKFSRFYSIILPQLHLMAASAENIASELALFEQKFKAAVKSQAPLLDRITHYIINRKGKQLRPRFVLLSAKLFGPVTETSYRAASLVELLHTATLVHDDVVDESLERRGFFSINALWKNKVAVLVGDYLLSKGLLLSLDNQEYQVLTILSQAVRQMSEGELLQIEKSRKLNLDEGVYFDIIRGKTASLLASACAAGAWSTTQNLDKTEQMRQFGELVGMAFQIKDDLFDYGSEDVGKPTGNDIKEKKLTLPLIYALQNSPAPQRRKMIYTLKNENRNPAKVKWLIEEVIAAGGIEYASKKMFEYRDQALAILAQLPQNEANKGLEELVRYTTDRRY
ncbi:MAG TPA: polyprenyl synthetase family protein [Phnomibacter sp.]|nr:polyprenyl synthetase family protein [Phnomibacter sp.]